MSLLILLTTIALGLVLLMALAMIFDWHPIANIKAMWKWWSVRFQTLCALVTAPLFFDPAAILGALNMLPGHIRSQLPEGVQSGLSAAFGVIFVLNVLSIIARGIDQPKARK